MSGERVRVANLKERILNHEELALTVRKEGARELSMCARGFSTMRSFLSLSGERVGVVNLQRGFLTMRIYYQCQVRGGELSMFRRGFSTKRSLFSLSGERVRVSNLQEKIHSHNDIQEEFNFTVRREGESYQSLEEDFQP